jgi:hypothetical protein
LKYFGSTEGVQLKVIHKPCRCAILKNPYNLLWNLTITDKRSLNIQASQANIAKDIVNTIKNNTLLVLLTVF